MSWLRSTELRGVAFAVALVLLGPAALAQDAHDHHAPAEERARGRDVRRLRIFQVAAR